VEGILLDAADTGIKIELKSKWRKRGVSPLGSGTKVFDGSSFMVGASDRSH
jgi:hypothetical protein